MLRLVTGRQRDPGDVESSDPSPPELLVETPALGLHRGECGFDECGKQR